MDSHVKLRSMFEVYDIRNDRHNKRHRHQHRFMKLKSKQNALNKVRYGTKQVIPCQWRQTDVQWNNKQCKWKYIENGNNKSFEHGEHSLNWRHRFLFHSSVLLLLLLIAAFEEGNLWFKRFFFFFLRAKKAFSAFIVHCTNFNGSTERISMKNIWAANSS